MSIDTDTSTPAKSYPSGRCRAVSQSARRRCRGAAGRGLDGTLCSTHAHENAPVTIDSDPVTLIRAVSAAYPARCRAIEHDGARCTTGCGPTDRFCALHKTISVPEVTGFLDEGELDVVLIKRALSAVQDTDESQMMADGGPEELPNDWTFRDLEGRVLSVVIDDDRLRYNDEQSTVERVVFERDHHDLDNSELEDRPRVVLLNSDLPRWTAHYYPEGVSTVTNAIGLSKDEERTTEGELHLYGEGAPDVTIEYLETAAAEGSV